MVAHGGPVSRFRARPRSEPLRNLSGHVQDLIRGVAGAFLFNVVAVVGDGN